MPAGYPKPRHPGISRSGRSSSMTRAANRAGWSGGLGTGLKTLQTTRGQSLPRAMVRNYMKPTITPSGR